MVLIAMGTRNPFCQIRSWKNVVTAVFIPTCAIIICALIILLSRKYDAFGIHKEHEKKCTKRLKAGVQDPTLHAALTAEMELGAAILPRICETYKTNLQYLDEVFDDCPTLFTFAAKEFNASRTIRNFLRGMVTEICANLTDYHPWAIEFADCYDREHWKVCQANKTSVSTCKAIREPYDCYVDWVRTSNVNCTYGATQYNDRVQKVLLEASGCAKEDEDLSASLNELLHTNSSGTSSSAISEAFTVK